MSVIAHLGKRDFVIGGDAIYMQAQLDGDAPLRAAPLRRPQLPPLAAGAAALPAASSPTRSSPRATIRSSTPGSPPATSSAAPSYISRTGAKISLAASSWRSRLGASSTGKCSGSPNSHGHLGEAQPLPAAHPRRAVDRDRDDRRSGLQRDPADPRFRLAQLAAARAPALGVDEQHLALVEDRQAVLNASSSWCAAAHREDATVLVDVGEDRRAEHLRLGHEADLAPQVDADEEVVHLAEVVGGEDQRARRAARSRPRSPAPGRSAASAARG